MNANTWEIGLRDDNTIRGFYDFSDLYQKFADEIPDGGHFLEVGVYLGKSIISLCEKVKKSGKDVKIYALDTFKNNHVYSEFLRNAIEHEVNHMITPIRAPSSIGLLQFPYEYFDVIYIDADHRMNYVLEDLNNSFPRLKTGGYLSGHDYYSCLGVQKGVNQFFGENKFEIIGSSWLYKKL